MADLNDIIVRIERLERVVSYIMAEHLDGKRDRFK